MYSVKIRDHIMIAHSLNHKDFGPAKNMHGATYVVDASFNSPVLNDMNIVIDIGLVQKVLKSVLKELDYQNLDNHPEMINKLTTTEFLAKYIHDKIKEAVVPGFEGTIEITLGESHIAWASYKGE